jgi:hypothetical protein
MSSYLKILDFEKGDPVCVNQSRNESHCISIGLPKSDHVKLIHASPTWSNEWKVAQMKFTCQSRFRVLVAPSRVSISKEASTFMITNTSPLVYLSSPCLNNRFNHWSLNIITAIALEIAPIFGCCTLFNFDMCLCFDHIYTMHQLQKLPTNWHVLSLEISSVSLMYFLISNQFYSEEEIICTQMN